MKLYNTLTGKKETFKPKLDKKVNLFVCGPTVYDYSHLGHARTYVAFDVMVKYLKEKGYKIFYLQNITDIDDKIIKRAEEENITTEKLTKNFEKEYLKDMKSLKINSVTKYARATDHIKEIIAQVKTLQKNGFAYQIADGIYYDISKFKNYGKLSKRTVSQAEDGISRIDEGKEKINKGDFCLWKFSKEGEPKWPSPWGEGRPGWHIEDTSITQKFFGAQYDIHGGGKDLMFPHHEAEIAQMEAISGKRPMVKYWIHTGFLTVNGKKMSKSLGNFITIQDFMKEHSARVLRFLMAKTHYRSPADYTEASVIQAKKELERIDEFVETISGSPNSPKIKGEVGLPIIRKQFEQAME
ncbi:MAG: cysteine--tRNA ligase, partial [Candidatus Nealsonbacteria bacterium]